MLVEFVAITLKIESVKTEIGPLSRARTNYMSSCKSESLRRRFQHPYKRRGCSSDILKIINP